MTTLPTWWINTWWLSTVIDKMCFGIIRKKSKIIRFRIIINMFGHDKVRRKDNIDSYINCIY